MKKGQIKIWKLTLSLVFMLFIFSSLAQAAQLANQPISIKAARLSNLERKQPQVSLKSNKLSAQILSPKTLFNKNTIATKKNGIVRQNKLSAQILSPKSLFKQNLNLKSQKLEAPKPAYRSTSRIK